MTEIAAEILRELHRFHRQQSDLKYRLESGPRQVAASQKAAELAEQHLGELQDTCKKMRLQSEEQQAQLRYRESEVQKLQEKLNGAKTNTEFGVFKNQIAAAKQANAVLEDEILEKLERLDQLQGQIQAAESLVVQRQQELVDTRERVEQKRPLLERELTRVAAGLREMERTLPADFKSDYQRLVRAHGPDSLAPVEGETCGNCNTLLSPQVMNLLFLSRAVFCKSCGSVLYLLEDRLPS